MCRNGNLARQPGRWIRAGPSDPRRDSCNDGEGPQVDEKVLLVGKDLRTIDLQAQLLGNLDGGGQAATPNGIEGLRR